MNIIIGLYNKLTANNILGTCIAAIVELCRQMTCGIMSDVPQGQNHASDIVIKQLIYNFNSLLIMQQCLNYLATDQIKQATKSRTMKYNSQPSWWMETWDVGQGGGPIQSNIFWSFKHHLFIYSSFMDNIFIHLFTLCIRVRFSFKVESK